MGGRSIRPKAIPVEAPKSVLTRDFRELPGDVALALEAVLIGSRQIEGIKAKETAIVKHHPFFGSMSTPFQRKVPSAVKGESTIEIPWGAFEVAGLGTIATSLSESSRFNGALMLTLAPKSDLAIWDRVCAAVVEALAVLPGVFRGRAIIVREPDDVITPVFIDLSKVVAPQFNEAVEEALEANIFRFIEGAKVLKAKGESLKRGVILEGHYGTGKTTLAYQVAQKCVQHELTFLMVPGELAGVGLRIAQILSPCWVFVEDLDASATGNRDALNNLLTQLSGIESKDADVGLLVSTNFIDRLDRAFLRPDRLDAIITLEVPDESTIGFLIEGFGLGYLTDEDFSEVQTYLKGATPAIIAEVVRRARVEAIVEDIKVSAARLLMFAKQMDRQRALAAPLLVAGTNAENLVKALEQVVEDGVNR